MNHDEISALMNSSVATSTSMATSTEQDTTLDATQESREPGDVTNAITDTVCYHGRIMLVCLVRV